MDTLYFHGELDPLSNMFACDLNWKGVLFHSSEAIYQAEKLRHHGFTDDNVNLAIIIHSKGDRGGFDAKRIAKNVCSVQSKSWETERVGVMKSILEEKCKQCEYYRVAVAFPGQMMRAGKIHFGETLLTLWGNYTCNFGMKTKENYDCW